MSVFGLVGLSLNNAFLRLVQGWVISQTVVASVNQWCSYLSLKLPCTEGLRR